MPVGNPRWPPPQDILDPMGKCSNALPSQKLPHCTWNWIKLCVFCSDIKFKKCFKTLLLWNHWKLKPNCPGMNIGRSSKVCVFYADRKSKMATRLTLDPMGKCSNAFFSETTNMIKAKLYKMWRNLTLDPMGEMFENASSLKPLEQLKPNCPGMIIGRSSTNFMFL